MNLFFGDALYQQVVKNQTVLKLDAEIAGKPAGYEFIVGDKQMKSSHDKYSALLDLPDQSKVEFAVFYDKQDNRWIKGVSIIA